MSLSALSLFVVYQTAGLILTLYGCFILTSLWLHWRSRKRHDWPLRQTPDPTAWPAVTVQLPIYNEPQVAMRVVRAAARLRYPRQQLQIQVLDDSTDGTAAALAQLVSQLRKKGLPVEYYHRKQRQGYKAGALATGLQHARGDYIAIFDADFVPEPDWLLRTLPALTQHPEIGFVQTRWEHLNRNQNALTAAQSLALDGHFVIEQQARSASGFWQNFNGSGGIWRRQAIAAAGGWSGDTVTEDLDLSYRAQLAGWRGAYINQVTAPAEVPPLVSGFKRQQKRWAKGSIQTLRKLAPAIMRSDTGWGKRLYALFHLGGYAMHLPLLILLILSLPLAGMAQDGLSMPLLGTISSMISVAPFLLYGLSQVKLRGRKGWRRLWALPVLALLSVGLSPAIAQSVVAGLLHKGGTFERTPKQGDGPRVLALPEQPFLHQLLPEFLAFGYALVTLLVIIGRAHWQLLPLPALYLLGTGLVLGLALHELRLMHRHPRWQQAPMPAAYQSSDL